MPTLEGCINATFEPGNIGSSTGTPPTVIRGGTSSPIITSASTDSVSENVTLSHALIANKISTWLIVGGADQAQFAISGSTLTWVANGTQNFEAPLDSDGDNIYVVIVSATASSLSTTQTISVAVTDSAEDNGTPIGMLLALTQLTSSGSAPTAPTISNIRTISSLNSAFNVSNGSSTTSNNLKVYGASGDIGATINVSLDGALQATATTDGSGNWACALGVIADGAHVATATITTGGGTSVASASYSFTITAGLTSLPVSVGQNITTESNLHWDATSFSTQSTTQSHNANPNCCIVVDLHTLSFTLLPTDVWDTFGPTGCRTEIETATTFIDGQTLNVTYEFKLPASNPVNDAFGSAGWTTIGDVHDAGSTSVPYNQFLGNWSSNSHAEAFTATIKSNGTQTDAYEGSSDLTRDVWHTLDIKLKLVAAGGTTGLLQTWLDGIQVINYSGDVGGIAPYHWKLGLYRGGTLDQTQVALYRNFQMRIT